MDFYTSSPLFVLAMVFGALLLISLIVTAASPTTVNARAVKAVEGAQMLLEKQEATKEVFLNPLSQREPPAITRYEVPVVLETKSFVPAPVAEPVPAPEEPKSKLSATFDAYRNAMKASNQRSAEAHQVSIAQKAGAANSAAWREQSSFLRNALRGQNTAQYLESMHQSVDDRMVAMFDAVPV